jgi:hypothetical protein
LFCCQWSQLFTGYFTTGTVAWSWSWPLTCPVLRFRMNKAVPPLLTLSWHVKGQLYLTGRGLACHKNLGT